MEVSAKDVPSFSHSSEIPRVCIFLQLWDGTLMETMWPQKRNRDNRVSRHRSPLYPTFTRAPDSVSPEVLFTSVHGLFQAQSCTGNS